MKYMGSKNHLLKNGLGKLIIEQSKLSNKFYDPFCGSASVVWFASKNIKNQIIASDLQNFSVNLANAVILRNRALSKELILSDWIAKAKKQNHYTLNFKYKDKIDLVIKSRENSDKYSSKGIISKSYGGYYFSLEQSMKYDYLLKTIPKEEPYYSIAKAALIISATFCVASPGHTAQPFQPTNTAIKYIIDAWSKDPFFYIEKYIKEICSKYANVKGKAKVIDAISIIDKVAEGDLIFIDPPYSGVHYSRFYHVLETISRGKCGAVSGRGRYPDIKERPSSDFSIKTLSFNAFDKLLEKISLKKASAIITFPAGKCSNGLSGEIVKDISKKYFKVKKDIIKRSFSTLGGNKNNRPARKESEELVLLLEPK